MSNSDDASKSNGVIGDPLQRLKSFKVPRDLSLGGVKPNKKLFTPNLNVTRNKNKGPSGNIRDNKKEDKSRKDRKNENKNKNFRNGPNIIKSSGVFSLGVGSGERHSTRAPSVKDSDSTPASLPRPTIRVKNFVKIDKELEEQKIKSAIGDAGFSETDASEAFRDGLRLDDPIKLPIDDGWAKLKKAALKVKKEVFVKQEPGDDGDISVERKPMLDVKKEVFDETNLIKLLMSEELKTILMEFPRSLPGRGGSVDDEPRRKINTDNPSTSSSEPVEETVVDERCYLTDMEEGMIGKIQVHRSGRVGFAIGDNVLEVGIGTIPAFQQDLMCLAVDDASRSANIISLGPLRNKICMVPNWEKLLNEAYI